MIKKFLALTAIAALCVSLAAVASAAPQVKKVKTRVTLSFVNGNTYPYTPYGQDKFQGKVKSKKKVCKKRRKVVLKRNGVSTGLRTRSDKKGNYSITVGNAAAGTYTTIAKKKKVRRNGTKIVCKKGTSNPVVVP